MKIKIILWRFFCFIFIGSSYCFGQQNPDIEIWKQEYNERIEKYLENCRKEQLNFLNDLQVTKPDYITFIPKIEPEKIGDTYNDHFLVFDKPNGMLFTVWTQATIEGAPDQHLVFSKSKDKGQTWSTPVVIAGSATINSGKPIASWGFPLVSSSGRIYILYNQFVMGKVSWNRQHTGIMAGIYSDDNGESWSNPEEIPMPRTINDHEDESIPAEWVVWQKPLRLAVGGKYLVGMSRYLNPKFHSKYQTVTEYLRFENIDNDPSVQKIEISYFMNNDKVVTYGSKCEEPSIVRLPDNRLFTLFRTTSGFPVWSVSEDEGENWSDPKPLLDKMGKPYQHPLSPCPLYDRKGGTAASGYYFAFIHNTPPSQDNPYQPRGPLYLIAGHFVPDAEQPIEFGNPQLFINRPSTPPYGQSFYTSTTLINGKLILWYPDKKLFLLGKEIDDNWFKEYDKK